MGSGPPRSPGPSPACPGPLSLPPDCWLVVDRWLCGRDWAALALTCRELRGAARRVACARGVSLALSGCDAERVARAALDALGSPAWRGLARLGVRLQPPGVVVAPTLPPLPALPALRRLEVGPCSLPEGPFWPRVLEGCPSLRHVAFWVDFRAERYALDQRHVADLVVHGAPRLESLDLRGDFLCIDPNGSNGLVPAGRSPGPHDRTPTVRSSVLRALAARCPQVLVGVDAPLESLEVLERATARERSWTCVFGYDQDATDEPEADDSSVLGRMGAVTAASVRRLSWSCGPDAFRPPRLSRFAALRDLEVRTGLERHPARLSARLAHLASLPACLERLSLRLDVWPARGAECRVRWGTPLAALTGLRSLRVRMYFPPSTVADLLAGWMGAPTGTREVEVRFRDEGSEADPVPRDGLVAWLDARPLAVARVTGLGRRFPDPAHPRVEVRKTADAAWRA